MTVCIAAICQKGLTVVGAADRMITIDERNISFEIPSLSKTRDDAPVLKAVGLNKHIVAMISGDAGFQSQALQRLWEKLEDSRKLETDPKSYSSPVKINEVAQFYVEFCNERMLAASNNFLAPYGLTVESFLEKQKNLSAVFVEAAISEIESIRAHTGDNIILTGLDETGAHIVICNGSGWTTTDSFGFAAIGSGGEHAESQFMLAEHTRDTSLEDTVLLAYVAKKRSEVSPTVGKYTDMFVIPPSGRYFLNHNNIRRLDVAYEKMQRSQIKAFDRAKLDIRDYVASLREEAEKRQLAVTKVPPTETEPPLSTKRDH